MKKHPRTVLAAVFVGVLWLGFLASGGMSQPQVSRAERFKQMSASAEQKGLAEAFRGITANGEVERGLFEIRSTGVSTAPVRNAADGFLKALTAEQRARTKFPVDDPEWRKWMNQHFYVRQGVSFAEMSERQREAAFGLLRTSLSARGLKLTRDIMRLNHTLGELNNNNFEEYGEWLYHLTVMGEPSAKEPWGWQLDGHHAIINYFVLGDQVVMTPLFVGSEPVIAESGKYKGTAILQEEQNRGVDLIRALPEAQRAKAILSVSKTRNNNLTEAFRDNVMLDYAGVPVKEFSAAHRRQLVDLVRLFVGNMADGHAKVRMREVEQHLERTWFAWIGGTDDSAVFYYRIHSPVVLIEFDHQSPAGLRHVMENKPNRQHIHVVVRTPNGGDYGKDLLRQHYAMHAH
jgi:hypothetical protein